MDSGNAGVYQGFVREKFVGDGVRRLTLLSLKLESPYVVSYRFNGVLIILRRVQIQIQSGIV